MDAVSFSNTLFDYIVVGAGASGLAVATRLSEAPGVAVGIIESGTATWSDPLVSTPAFWPENFGNDNVTVNFGIIPQTHAGGTEFNITRGKTLGGSTALNTMVWSRGSMEDYARWEALGNPGWNFNTLLPYFEKSETFMRNNFSEVFPGIPSSNPVHLDEQTIRYFGKSGPVHPSLSTWYGDVTVPYVEALVANGVPVNDFTASGNVSGVTNALASIDRRTGTRAYAAPAYLNGTGRLPAILTSAQVTRLILDTQSANNTDEIRAKGVEFIANNKTFSVAVRREVIVAAGALETPKLLELSGVGNATLLREFGINPLIDLPGVGENYQDHVGVTMDFKVKPGVQTYDELQLNSSFAAAAAAEYAAKGTGILANSGLTAFAFLPLSTAASPADLASFRLSLDAQLSSTVLTPMQSAQYDLQMAALDKDEPTMEIFMAPRGGLTGVPAANTSYISVLSIIGHPFSRGSVHINTTDPFAHPVIDPNVFAIDYDLSSLVKVAQLARRVVHTEPIASLIEDLNIPSRAVHTDDEFAAFIRKTVSSVSHPMGTAALAPRSLGGVVSPQLLVYGTSNVRIVDASIFPMLMSAHLQATVYAVAERAAEIIKACNGL